MADNKVVIVEEKEPGCFGQGAAMVGVLVSGLWLLNFTVGVFEIPDVLPFVGSVDEAAAAAMFISCLRYLGIDILPFGRKRTVETREVIDVTPVTKTK